MHIADAPNMAAHKGDRVKPGIGMVAGVKADLQKIRVDLAQEPLQFRLEIHETRRMGMDPHGQPVIGAHLGDLAKPLHKGGPFGWAHLLGLSRASRRRRAPGRDAVDQHQMLGAVADKCPAGPLGGILQLVPGVWVVEGAKHHAADQRHPVLRKPVAQDRRVFGHEPDGAQFDAPVSRSGTVRQDPLPGRIARIIREFHAPGTGRIANFDHLETSTHAFDLCDWCAASTTCITASPSRNCGQTGRPVSIARRKSRASMVI